jgi:hypothetical protein
MRTGRPARRPAWCGDRQVHGVGDAAYHGKALLVADTTTWTTRLPANASLSVWGPAPDRQTRGPRLKGAKLGKLKDLAAAATWTRTSVYRYGRTETVDLAIIEAIWYGPFANTPGHQRKKKLSSGTGSFRVVCGDGRDLGVYCYGWRRCGRGGVLAGLGRGMRAWRSSAAGWPAAGRAGCGIGVPAGAVDGRAVDPAPHPAGTPSPAPSCAPAPARHDQPPRSPASPRPGLSRSPRHRAAAPPAQPLPPCIPLAGCPRRAVAATLAHRTSSSLRLGHQARTTAPGGRSCISHIPAQQRPPARCPITTPLTAPAYVRGGGDGGRSGSARLMRR